MNVSKQNAVDFLKSLIKEIESEEVKEVSFHMESEQRFDIMGARLGIPSEKLTTYTIVTMSKPEGALIP